MILKTGDARAEAAINEKTGKSTEFDALQKFFKEFLKERNGDTPVPSLQDLLITVRKQDEPKLTKTFKTILAQLHNFQPDYSFNRSMGFTFKEDGGGMPMDKLGKKLERKSSPDDDASARLSKASGIFGFRRSQTGTALGKGSDPDDQDDYQAIPEFD